MPEPDRSPLDAPRTAAEIYDEGARQQYRDHLQREREEVGRRAQERAAQGGLGLGNLAAFVLAGLGIGSIVLLHDVIATLLGDDLLPALADLVPSSWPATGLRGVAVQAGVAMVVAAPLWLVAWLVKRVRTTVAVQFDEGLGWRMLRWGWLTAATLVRAVFTLAGIAMAWAMFTVQSQGFVDPVLGPYGWIGVGAAALLILPASMARAFFLPRSLPA